MIFLINVHGVVKSVDAARYYSITVTTLKYITTAFYMLRLMGTELLYIPSYPKLNVKDWEETILMPSLGDTCISHFFSLTKYIHKMSYESR